MLYDLQREVFMKKLSFIFLIMLMAFTENCFAKGKDGIELPSERIQKFETYLDELAEVYHIPGMAFFITSPDHTLFEKAYGECTSLDQQFFIGSMSKSYTALCVMQLVEKGKIKLEDDISVYLPDYKFSKPVTVLSLLNHTSGFDTHAKLHNAKLTKSYGKYEYANVNYDLLGKIIEKVSGMAYEDYIKQNVFNPLEMEDSNANARKVKDSPKLLRGNRNYFGFFKKEEAIYPVEKSWFHEPAGYIATTPHNHAKYLRMYLNEGVAENRQTGKNQIISQESINSMWYKNVSLGVKEYDAYYGMGWNFMEWKGQKLVFHGGQVENGITYMFILPDEKLGVCFMLNASDQFGLNNLMDNAIWDSLSIIRGEEPEKINHKSYVLLHIMIDAVYLCMLCFSIFILIRSIKTKRRISIIFAVSCYIIWPLLLIFFTKIFIQTPLWVVQLFVPDLYIIIILSVILSVVAGIIKVIKVIGR